MSVSNCVTDAQFARIFEAVGCRTQVELAHFLEIRQSSVSYAKKRGSIPAEWLLKLLLGKGIHPAWILTGQGSRLLGPVDMLDFPPPAPERVMQVRPPEECTTQELVTEIVRRYLAVLSCGM